jgi:D-arginine dehydrogenase
MKSDFLVIGGGIAGVSAAYELARHGSVVVLEQEGTPGYHTTGRSAAISSLNFISPVVQALTVVSRDFLARAPECFGEYPLTSFRQSLWVTQHHQLAAHELMRQEAIDRKYKVRELSADEVIQRCPVLRRDRVAKGLIEEDTLDLDVHGMLHGYIRGVRASGGTLVLNAEVESISKHGDLWTVRVGGTEYVSPVLVNAAGAWGDVIAKKAGVIPIPLRPLRRTVFTFEAPAGVTANSWPFVYDTAEEFYFKLENGIILASAFDEIESVPCDVRPEEFDIAVAIDKIQNATTLDIRSLKNKWAGLRTFAPDRELVVGEDTNASGFYWVAGHGGIGLMTAPGVAQALVSLVVSGDVPQAFRAMGVTREALSIARFNRECKAPALAADCGAPYCHL